MTLEEIKAALQEIIDKLASDEELTEEEIQELEEKANQLETEKRTLMERTEKRNNTLEKIKSGMVGKELEKFEERKEEDNMNQTEYRSAYFKNLLGRTLTETEQRAFDAAGAQAVIPTETADEIIKKVISLAPVLEDITLLHAKGNIKFAVEGTKVDGAIHQENTTITADADTLVTVSLAGYEVTKLVQVSKTVETMSVDMFESWLIDMIAEMLASKLENLVYNGSGQGEAKGILTETYTSGTNMIEVGASANLSAQNVRDLIALLPAGYDANAKFAMNKKTLFNSFMGLQDNAKHDLVKVEGNKYFIYGYPVRISAKIADNVAILGDFKKYVGNLSEDINIIKDFDINTNSNKYLGSCVFDGKTALTEAFVKLGKATE